MLPKQQIIDFLAILQREKSQATSQAIGVNDKIMSLPYNEKLIGLSKILRKNMTKQESKLWYQCLSGSSIRFQRQKVIDDYIVDFYCHKAKLVIEIDGSQHESTKGLQSDAQRTEKLEQYGLVVIRFSNIDIDNNFNYVCSMINNILQERI